MTEREGKHQDSGRALVLLGHVGKLGSRATGRREGGVCMAYAEKCEKHAESNAILSINNNKKGTSNLEVEGFSYHQALGGGEEKNEFLTPNSIPKGRHPWHFVGKVLPVFFLAGTKSLTSTCWAHQWSFHYFLGRHWADLFGFGFGLLYKWVNSEKFEGRQRGQRALRKHAGKMRRMQEKCGEHREIGTKWLPAHFIQVLLASMVG